MTLEDYIILNYFYDDLDNNDNILEGKMDFISNIDNGMLTISCKYCDIKIDINKSKLELYLGNTETPNIEIPGKDFIQFIELKDNIQGIENLSDAKDKLQDSDFKQNINFVKKFFSKYSNDIQKAINDIPELKDKEKIRLEWKLILDKCQIWPPKSEALDEKIKLYLDFSMSMGCIIELSKDDFKNAATLGKAIINTYLKNGGAGQLISKDSPVSLKLNDFEFEGMKFTELVKKFKEVFANGNIGSLIEILKEIPKFVFGMPIDNSKDKNDSKEFISQLKQVIKKSIPKLKELKNSK